MKENDLLDWYEASLPAKERKLRGHFSTPAPLVAQILDACGYTAKHDLSQLRVLDPACGSGNFVAGATQRLIAYGQRAGLSQAAIAKLVSRNIWGFDPDPVACFLAEMQVRSIFSSCIQPDAEPDIVALPTLASHAPHPCEGKSIEPSRLHIHQADSLTLSWTNVGSVDLLLANPPYLAAKNSDLSVYRSARQRGQADSYLLFMEQALQIVRPGGWLGLVLPDPVLARANAARERKRLLAETTVHHLWHIAGIFAAYVGAVVIIAQKCPPAATHSIAWRRERQFFQFQSQFPSQQGGPERRGTVSQALLRSQPGAELRYFQFHSPAQFQIPDKAVSLMLLKDCVRIYRGEELSKESPLLKKIPTTEEHEPPEDYYPVLRGGGDIRPYRVPCAEYWIAHNKINKPLERYLAPKLLVVKSTDKLRATLDMHGHVTLQTLYMLVVVSHPDEVPNDHAREREASNQRPNFSAEDELYYLLALLNSRLLQEYVWRLHTAYKWVQPQIEQSVLANLPIPTTPDPHEKEQLIRRARHMMQACSDSSCGVELKEQYQVCYEEQERAICRLYQAAIQARCPEEPVDTREPAPPLDA